MNYLSYVIRLCHNLGSPSFPCGPCQKACESPSWRLDGSSVCREGMDLGGERGLVFSGALEVQLVNESILGAH